MKSLKPGTYTRLNLFLFLGSVREKVSRTVPKNGKSTLYIRNFFYFGEQSAQPTETAEPPAPVVNLPVDEWDVMYDDAVKQGKPLPFGRYERVDLNAWRYRGVRKGDPCAFKALIRRITYDLNKMTVLEDVYKAERENVFSWRKLLPQAPLDINTKFFFYLGNQSGGDMMELAIPKPVTALKVPVKPGTDEVFRHCLTHSPFAPWCQDCVAGRSRGMQHHPIQDRKIEEFEVDYTFYSEAGYTVEKEQKIKKNLI